MSLLCIGSVFCHLKTLSGGKSDHKNTFISGIFLHKIISSVENKMIYSLLWAAGRKLIWCKSRKTIKLTKWLIKFTEIKAAGWFLLFPVQLYRVFCWGPCVVVHSGVAAEVPPAHPVRMQPSSQPSSAEPPTPRPVCLGERRRQTQQFTGEFIIWGRIFTLFT